MLKYTTGEIAKLCKVSVRTVQYYDTRGLLIPSELSEGGRRLYTESDLKKMQTICFLRDMGLSINSIMELFSEDTPENFISILVAEQQELLKSEIKEHQEKLSILDEMLHYLKAKKEVSLDTIGDIAKTVKNRKKISKSKVYSSSMGHLNGHYRSGHRNYMD